MNRALVIWLRAPNRTHRTTSEIAESIGGRRYPYFTSRLREGGRTVSVGHGLSETLALADAWANLPQKRRDFPHDRENRERIQASRSRDLTNQKKPVKLPS